MGGGKWENLQNTMGNSLIFSRFLGGSLQIYVVLEVQWALTNSLLFSWLMHVMVQERLKTIGLFMNNSFKVVINLILLCAIAWLTCMQNVGACGMWAKGRRQESCFNPNVFVGSSLVDMYAKFGSMEDAWRVFNKNLYEQ
jgi:hypothetical protein